MNQNHQSSLWAVLGAAVVLLAHLPLLLLGENSYVWIHDNLDSDFIYLHLMKISETLSPWTTGKVVPYIMNGVPVEQIHSPFSFIRLLFYLLPSYWAYAVNSILVRLIGWLGVYLLARDYFRPSSARPWVLLVVGSSFALLPTYSIYGLSALGQPLMLWCFLNLQHRRRLWVSGLLVLLYPFYSHFALIAPFLLGALALYGMVERWLFKRAVSGWYVVGLVGMTVCYLFTNQTIILNFLSSTGEVSHRTEWYFVTSTWGAALKGVVNTFFKGYAHAAQYQLMPLLILVGWAVWRKTMHGYRMFGGLLIILGLSVMWELYPYLANILHEPLHLLTSFQFRRLAFLLPMIIVVISLWAYQDTCLRTWIVGGAMVAFGALSLLRNAELTHNWGKLILPTSYTDHLPTYRRFFAESMFERIKADLGDTPSTYRVVNLGIHPSVAQYNGFYTLDGYLNNYPLHYKHQFRGVIAGELEKSEALRRYFDDWGSRCYLFSAKLWSECAGTCYKTKEDRTLEVLDINTEALRKLGGRYVFSAVRLAAPEALGWTLLNTYNDIHSMYTIHVYQL